MNFLNDPRRLKVVTCDIDSYRVIMISNTVTKLLEIILMYRIITARPGEEYQFDFSSSHNTGLCTGMFLTSLSMF